jgi:hypothetical protein
MFGGIRVSLLGLTCTTDHASSSHREAEKVHGTILAKRRFRIEFLQRAALGLQRAAFR